MEIISAVAWTIFSITSPMGIDYVPEVYTQIMIEWFPVSQYKRDEDVPNLEVFPAGMLRMGSICGRFRMPMKLEWSNEVF